MGQATLDQGLVHAQPGEGDEAEWEFDVVAGIAREVGEGVGDAGDAAQQAELVGGGFLLAQDHAAKGGQRAGAVVRQIENDRLPSDLGTAADVRLAAGGDAQGEAVVQAEALDLELVDRPHRPVVGGGAVAQGEHHAPARLEQGGELAHGAAAIGRGDVHPDPGQPDQVEAEAEAVDVGECRETVVDPADGGGGVAALGFLAQGGGGFDGDDFPTPGGEIFGVAPAAGADVEHQARCGGKVGERLGVDVGEAEGVVRLGEFAEAAVVGGDGVPAHRCCGPDRCWDGSLPVGRDEGTRWRGWTSD